MSTEISRVIFLSKQKQSLKCEEAMHHDSSSSMSSWPELLCRAGSWDFLESATGTFALKLTCVYQVSRTRLFVGAVWWKSRYSEHYLYSEVSWITSWLCPLSSLPKPYILVESSWVLAYLIAGSSIRSPSYTIIHIFTRLKIADMSELFCLKVIRPSSFECTLHPRACHPTLKSVSVGCSGSVCSF